MKKIYQNFDGLEVSFQCAIPQYILEQLEIAKLEAQKFRHDVPAKIGTNEILVTVAETGAKGGYRYRFDSGLDGATWFIAPSSNPDHWNVRVSCKSLMLALHGYFGAKERIINMLTYDLEANFPLSINGIFGNSERVSRFDYCFDFVSEEFLPDAKCFIAHSRTEKNYIQHVNVRGQHVETLRVGTMPNRQIIIYNKGREITVHAKPYWWDIWEIKKDELKGIIWRIEIRAGKKELNNWNCRKFADLEKMAGDIIIHALKSYRYVIPNENDANITRWEMTGFWKNCIKYSEEYLSEYISNAKREKVIRDYRANLMERYEKCFLGLATSYMAVLGLDKSQTPAVLDIIASDVARRIDENPQKFAAKFAKAENKFEFLGEKKVS